MSIGNIGAYGGINPYEISKDKFSNVTTEDAVEMADAVDFDDNLNQVQNVAGVQPVEKSQDAGIRIEPAERSSDTSADHIQRELSHVKEDLMDIQGNLWGFSLRREIPLVEQL